MRRADELRDRLRADEGRARSFAREMRVGAAGLEDATVRWGPTLAEAPDSAELLNLLPDIVDSARAAAQAIDPVAGARETGLPDEARTEHDRRRFEDSLLEILTGVEAFDRRRPPSA